MDYNQMLDEIEASLKEIEGLVKAIRAVLRGDNAPDPINKSVSTCNRCGEVIEWKKSRKGKNYPVNLDGSYHSVTCTGPKGESKPKPADETEGIPF